MVHPGNLIQGLLVIYSYKDGIVAYYSNQLQFIIKTYYSKQV